jgi:hypothetical protein
MRRRKSIKRAASVTATETNASVPSKMGRDEELLNMVITALHDQSSDIDRMEKVITDRYGICQTVMWFHFPVKFLDMYFSPDRR